MQTNFLLEYYNLRKVVDDRVQCILDIFSEIHDDKYKPPQYELTFHRIVYVYNGVRYTIDIPYDMFTSTDIHVSDVYGHIKTQYINNIETHNENKLKLALAEYNRLSSVNKAKFKEFI